MISFNEFSLMKDTSYIINIARGGIITDDALINALENKKIAGAALDVFTSEPLKQGHPYFNFVEDAEVVIGSLYVETLSRISI